AELGGPMPVAPDRHAEDLTWSTRAHAVGWAGCHACGSAQACGRLDLIHAEAGSIYFKLLWTSKLASWTDLRACRSSSGRSFGRPCSSFSSGRASWVERSLTCCICSSRAEP